MEEVTNDLQEVECPEPVEGSFFVYLLLCVDGSIYCGSTGDLQNRLKEHRSGEATQWTKKRQPIKLVYFEIQDSLIHARRREQQIKGWSKTKKMKLISGTWEKVI